MTYKVNVGDPLPTFKIKDSEGYELTDEDLLGSPVVLYFYPKDSTPTCTQEACEFRDNMEQLDVLDALVIGISPDNSASHDKFTLEHDINFTLLPDEQLILSRKFDVWHNDRVERTTFVIDSDGIIQWIERPVNVPGHIHRVIDAVKKLEDANFDFS